MLITDNVYILCSLLKSTNKIDLNIAHTPFIEFATPYPCSICGPSSSWFGDFSRNGTEMSVVCATALSALSAARVVASGCNQTDTSRVVH